MTTRSYDTTIISDDDSSMCAIDVPFDPKEVFGKVRAPVKVTLNSYTFRSTIARMDETSTGTKLYARNWDFAVDAVAGGAFEFLNLSGERGELRMFVHAEGGYGWSTASDLRLSPDEEDESAPQRVAALDLGTLALRGPMFRVMVSAAF